ncbi:MAG: hypothetical protein A2289_07755 [Deltaproteobacteria bacterium RIFOXYA12_FULL_58_15]|nr:MAG: hypothetical protein A2289_07755 [Deltaproteobacteria bacterium RIFOXYA12_FULL_58_15]
MYVELPKDATADSRVREEKANGPQRGPEVEAVSNDRLVVLVTGSVASGKTSLLERLQGSTARWWRICGFTSKGNARDFRCGNPSATYRLSLVGLSTSLPWAMRPTPNSAFQFCEATRLEVTEAVGARLKDGTADICFLDEIGQLELAGRGFAELFRLALTSPCRIVVAAVKKSRFAEVVAGFGLAEVHVIDLDQVSAEQGFREAKRQIATSDAERIGAFAGIGGLVEVGLGSTLHAYRVPFKGHALAYLQNVLLVAFGKALHGRGLVRISFISAMLKAFSPAGGTFRPMAYIFLQGLSFAAPIRLLGWNIGSVIMGSVIMGWLTLAMSLAVDYVTFGKSIFDAFGAAIAAFSSWLGVQGPSLLQVLIAAFALKAAVAVGLAIAAFFGDMQPLVRRLGARKTNHGDDRGFDRRDAASRRSMAMTAVTALRDLSRPRFVVAFLVSALLLLFFAGLPQSDFMNLIVRGLCISYLGFVALRRIDVQSLGAWLDRHTGMGLGRSLPVALDALGRTPAPPPTSNSVNASPPSSPMATVTYRSTDSRDLDVPPGSLSRTP